MTAEQAQHSTDVERVYDVDDALGALPPFLQDYIRDLQPYDRNVAIEAIEKIVRGAFSVGYDEGSEAAYRSQFNDNITEALETKGGTDE